MISRAMHFLEGWPMTIVSGLALAASGIMLLCGVHTLYDPAWLSVLISGLPLLYLALTRLVLQRWISSALLICIAMFACIYIGELFAAGEVAFIMAIGALLEEHTVNRAKKGITSMVRLVPQTARLLSGEEVPVADIRPGDVVRVLPGERIPVDGEIVEGNTSVDQSVLTGESMPVDKTVGDSVYSGTMNTNGSVDVRALRVGKDSSIEKIIALMKEAENNKAPMQRIVDVWAAWLVPIALLIALGAWLVTGDIERGVTVLVVFCPCALALATPVSIIAGIGQATKHGVLIKSGKALEIMGKVDCITFDKTGTLTRAALQVSDVVTFGDLSQDELLRLCASVELRSEHPLGRAIVEQAKGLCMSLPEVSDFTSAPGKGISGIVDGKKVMCGNAAYITGNGVRVNDESTAALDALRADGKALVIVAVDGQCAGAIALSDEIRETSREMVSELRKMRVSTVVLTGDNRRAALYFARKLGIDDIRAELLPGGKVAEIKRLEADGHTVCMIGDGVNDAPALKTADVSVAMGGMGSDIAVDSADIALMGDDISKVPYLKRLGIATVKSIKLNIAISMTINAVAVTMSVLGWLGPISGALVHNAGSVLVVLNAALLYDRKV